VVSIKDIEDRAGFTFFRNLNPAVAKEVKSQKKLSDWNF
jgi:DNA/RNA endonuclease G (NUC1)